MSEDIYYYKPDVPMYVMMEEFNVCRVRVVKFVDGKMHSALSDWDSWNIGSQFYPINVQIDYFDPFYYIEQLEDGTLCFPASGLTIDHLAKTFAPKTGLSEEEIKNNIIESAHRVGCPITTKEEARKFVFAR